MNKPTVNRVDILEKASQKHRTFIKDFGLQSDKVRADHKLALEVVSSRIEEALVALRHATVIDGWNPDTYGAYRRFTLYKNGFDNTVSIMTNGITIITSDVGMWRDYDWRRDECNLHYDVDSDKFDWTNFSMEIVDMVHKIIYRRQEAVMVRLFGDLKS